VVVRTALMPVVEPGESFPEDGVLAINPPIAAFATNELLPDDVFWARYENAFGETWETTNPHNPLDDVMIEALDRSELARREQAESDGRRAVQKRLDDMNAAVKCTDC
jgi:hypothetical protein